MLGHIYSISRAYLEDSYHPRPDTQLYTQFFHAQPAPSVTSIVTQKLHSCRTHACTHTPVMNTPTEYHKKVRKYWTSRPVLLQERALIMD